jgi:dTDP-4-amino-4,6-dideoxygalactose transaminase
VTDAAIKNIPILDLSPEIDELWHELTTAVERVMRSGQFIGGSEVAAFEAEVAAYLGVKHAIGVNSGTDALIIGLRSLGVKPGDEVITTPFSFFATAEAISNVGATPVFVDIEEESFNIDPDAIEAAITPRTKALLPVHIYGRPAAMGQIMAIADQHGLKVLEDCAQSFGARYQGRHTGAIGHLGAFSFYPTKNLGAFGDGGLITTNDDGVAELARMLGAHGSKKRYHNVMLGYNSRLDAMQAALLRVKLPRVDQWNATRIATATRYNQLLAEAPGVITPALAAGHVFHQYTVRLPGANRDAVQQRMAQQGVGTMVYYPIPQDRLPVYDGGHPANPNSERAAQEVLSLPIGTGLSDAELRRVSDVLQGALR